MSPFAYSVVSLVRTLETAVMERWLNIDTVSQLDTAVDQEHRERGNYWYETCGYSVISRYLEHLRLRRNDCAYDVGCGAGRVLAILARMKLRKVVGIELLPELAALARANLMRLRGRRTEFEVRTGDATAADYSDGTVYVLFNPFDASTLARVLTRIRASVTRQPRTVRLLYLNPVYDSVMAATGWLNCSARRGLLGVRTRASYWTNGVPPRHGAATA